MASLPLPDRPVVRAVPMKRRGFAKCGRDAVLSQAPRLHARHPLPATGLSSRAPVMAGPGGDFLQRVSTTLAGSGSSACGRGPVSWWRAGKSLMAARSSSTGRLRERCCSSRSTDRGDVIVVAVALLRGERQMPWSYVKNERDDRKPGPGRGDPRVSELLPGTVLQGKYVIERLIAEGGMSRLYRGYPLQGAALVAIKQLDLEQEGGATSEDLEQFEKEYQILHSLDHPGLARALDFFEQDGHWYLVEEFVPGPTLDSRMQQVGRLNLDEAVNVISMVLYVLEHLHGHGVVYRDLKPSNIILQPSPGPCDGDDDAFPITARHDVVRLVDFGAARRWKRGAARDTVLLGTPGYAPPEQYGSAQSDPRSDLYSAGVLLHAMLSGQALDPARGWVFEAPHKVVPGLPVELSRIVMQAVEVAANRRFQSAGDMRKAIKRAAGRMPRCPGCGQELPEEGGWCDRCSRAGVRPGTWPTCLVVAAIFVGLVFLHFVSVGFRTRHQGRLTGCKSNLKNIGTAVELYSSDSGGRFPNRLTDLERRYLKAIPTCPSAATNTYTRGYSNALNPDAYTVVCAGSHHSNLNQGENYPQYTSTLGLISQ